MAVRRKQREFKELKVWQKAHRLTLDAYRATSSFPREELFGITSQIRRSASSVPANIAEGCGRAGGDLARFCAIAAGSASEMEYHLILAHDLVTLICPRTIDPPYKWRKRKSKECSAVSSIAWKPHP